MTTAPHEARQTAQGVSTARPAIGLLTHGAGDPNNSTIWSGVADFARQNGLNLVCFPGKPLRSSPEFEAQSNVVFDLVNTQTLAGLVIWLAGLAHRADLLISNAVKFTERGRVELAARVSEQGVAAVLGKGLFSAPEVMAQVETVLERNKRLGYEAQRIVRQAMAYMNEHYMDSISRSELAQHLAISETYLTRCFRQEMGIAPMTYLNRCRIKQARALLETGAASVSEVAFLVGFSDASYFARVFRKEVGVAPSACLDGNRR